ncbi:MAG: rhomboid family intramembrane serine protease [Lachnospiraceae bacterium]|nr:rhomboid family intramembrane serine protease [Lachnospiraceae bacterium]
MKFFDRLEEKFGRFAIKNLTLYLVILNIAGFILLYTNPAFYYLHLSLDMERIFAGEVWRLFTFMIYPSTNSILLLFLEMFILYSLGNTLERLWGRFYYNLYIFLGMFFLVIAALAIYLISGDVMWLTPSNLYMTLLLAFAMTLPDMQFLLYFIIPIKAKYLAIFYVGIMAYEFIRSDWTGRIAVIASFANAIIFFLMIKNPAKRVRQAYRKHQFDAKVRDAARRAEHMRPMSGTRHVCSVCGRTEKDDPNLEFRYCSKCSGNREYCQDHLYTHVHVTEDGGGTY